MVSEQPRRSNPGGLHPLNDNQTWFESTGTYVLVLNWDPSRQGGVTGVVRQLERSIAAQGWLTPVVAVDTWEALAPRRSGTVWHLRLATPGVPTSSES